MKKWLEKLKNIDNQESSAEIATFSAQKNEIVFPAQPPKANCMSGECEYCCSLTVNYQSFAYCNKIGYAIIDLFNDYGSCPTGKWMKSKDHYNKLIIAMEE